MDDEALLNHLQTLEEDSAAFVWGALGGEREKAQREYFRMPYGNEEDGWSSIVTSDVQDTVEWILPQLLDIFAATDSIVSFEPTKAEDVKGAEQATDTCNYVFTKKNDGFLILYTAIKDALLVKNGAVHWRKETKRRKVKTPLRGVSEMQLTMALEQGGELLNAEPVGQVQDPMTGEALTIYNATLEQEETTQEIKVEAFPPEDLLVKRDWTKPLLHDCPYVARIMRVTLSDLVEMGYTDVTAEDLAGSDDPSESADAEFRTSRLSQNGDAYEDDTMVSVEDDSLTEGYLRIEYVLVDYDGDGIAERRCIYRLKNKILKNEEESHVPIATASPILVAHRWDGMSIAETVSDIQQLKTEMTRQMLNSLYLANTPRTKVLTDAQGSPMANIDDLLDNRPGGVLRTKSMDGLQEYVTPFVGGQTLPILEYVDAMRENRTGVTRYSQGLGADGLEKTNGESARLMNASQMRIKLIARIMAECLVKPIFQGILKLLTEGDMQKIAFRLRNDFVEYDPQEWRDSYDMTINVGLGTGDKDMQLRHLSAIFQSQMALAQSPFGPALIDPTKIYNTQAKLVENAGFKNVGDFWKDPAKEPPPPQQPPPPPPQVLVKQMELAADAQKFQAEQQLTMQRESLQAEAKQRETQMQLELQAANDARDAEREQLMAMHKQQLAMAQLELDRYKTDADNKTKIITARIAHPESQLTGLEINPETGEVWEKPDPMDSVMQALGALVEQSNAPKAIVRDETGKVVGVQQGSQMRTVVRDESGKVIGVQ
ncbi:portal protein [Acidovorax sp. BL-A-41-H1]|uniref:portal protein n=1 Tax=Acidovorax sp. BL-A-41-H1 TaxID=3421102 RepID=UPI003F7A3CDC